MRKYQALIILLFMILNSSMQACLACTDFQITTNDETFIIGRSMEWGSDLHSRLVIHPRRESHTSSAPNGKPGVKWCSKYGYVGADANGLDTTLDGLNEKGLSFGALWLPQYTRYQTISSTETNKAINFIDLGNWILGNFATIDEVRKSIEEVRIWSNVVVSFGGIPTAHIALHDATGKNLVIEFINGEQKLYDNPISVLTNAPPFDWHLINLSNYLMIGANNHQSVKIAGTVLTPPGQGNGFFGIPGDWTPPSRFVRTAAMLTFARKTATAEDGVNLAQHILNAVDIPQGEIRQKTDNVEYSDYTQWAIIKDLTHKILYSRSYNNLTLHALDLKKVDFSPGTKLQYLDIDIKEKNQ